MSKLDIVIFGATGFTGKKAVEEMCRVGKKYNVTWGVAGRSQSKLESLIAEVSKKAGEDLSGVRVIIAEVSDEKSLKDMCSQAKVIANCCGPYRLYGEPVVRAAVESKTHYVDVSGEPQFMETMQLKYYEAAAAAGVYVVSACGFDSIPNDMGVVFLKQHFGGTVNAIESYLSTYVPPEHNTGGAGIHYGTWESLVHSLAHSNELAPLRSKLYPEKLPSFTPKLAPRSTLHKRGNNWCLPFPGADNSIVYRTQRYFYEKEQQRPIQFKAYVKFPNLFYTIGTAFGAVILYLMTLTQFTRSLLLKYPRVFSFGMVSHEGPAEEYMNNTFFKFELVGEGWEQGTDEKGPTNKTVVAKVTGVNPGYGATVTALIISALTVLREQHKMPGTGGVMTTGVAFSNTDLIKNLNENNLKFEIVENK